ncbi:MAG: DUF2807 domain-containing protein [Draconibacterium sp.]|nr:DUF2807 domain-containing protein [Draconibacterium sp.]
MRLVLFFSIFTLIYSSVDANSKNVDDWNSKIYDVGEFTEIYIEGGYKVYLIQGDENSLKVKASDDDVFDYLKIKNNGGELTINVVREHFNFDRIILYITFKELKKVNIEGGVKLETKGYLDLANFEMYVAGGAKIELAMKAKDVHIVGEGGVLFELKGVAESLDIKISGAGHIDAEELKSEDVSIQIEGVGTASVYATTTLNAKIEGVGRVTYSGDPKVTRYIDGLGSIKRN